MVITDIKEARNCLRRYNDFQECIIKGLLFNDYFTTLEMMIINIWSKDGQLRNDLDSNTDIVHLKFKGLISFRLFNDLNQNILSNLDKINWGYNEIALVKIAQKENSFMKFSFLWESNRAIELICNKLELMEEAV